MTFLDTAWPVIVPLLAAFLVPRIQLWALPCVVILGAAGVILSLSEAQATVAVLGAASHALLAGFAIWEMTQRFLSGNKKKGVFEQ